MVPTSACHLLWYFFWLETGANTIPDTSLCQSGLLTIKGSISSDELAPSLCDILELSALMVVD